MNFINKYVGKVVVVRSTNAGVFIGTLLETDGNSVVLSNCKRVWNWEGACSISQISTNGVNRSSRISVAVREIMISEVIEIIPAEDKAVEIIYNIPEWKI